MDTIQVIETGDQDKGEQNQPKTGTNIEGKGAQDQLETGINIEGLFSNLIEPATPPASTISQPNILTLESNPTDEEEKPKKRGRQSKSKDGFTSTQKKVLARKNREYQLTLKQIHPDLMLKSRVLGIKQIQEDKDKAETVNLTSEDESWEELILFLLGLLQYNDPNNFEVKLAKYGILNESIQITKSLRLLLDKESGNIRVYELPGTDYLVKLYFRQTDIYNSILHCLEALNIKLNKLRLVVIQPEEEVAIGKIGTKTRKKGSTQPRHQSDTPTEIELSSIKIRYTLSEILKPRGIIAGRVIGIGVYGEEMGVSGIRQSLGYLLSFLHSLYPEESYQSMIKWTKPEVIGVTSDQQDYIGQMKLTSIPGTDLYYYTNGQSTELYNYISSIAKDLNIPDTEITFTYEELRLG